MAWIEFHDTVVDHYKTKDLARSYGCELNSAIGMLSRFWLWCVKYADDGDLRKHNDNRIGDSVGLNGEDSKRFVDAMVQSCWIDRKPYFRVHDWWDYAKSFLKSRYKDEPAKWQRIKGLYEEKARELHRSSTRATPATNQPNQPTNQPLTPNSGAVGNGHTPKPENDVQRVVKGWKVLTGIPIEGPESQSWDRVHFARHAKSAKALIDLFGSRVDALRCMEHVYHEMTRKKLTCTIETIVKHSDLYRERLAKQEAPDSSWKPTSPALTK